MVSLESSAACASACAAGVGSLGHFRAQIPETRWRDDSKALTHEFRGISEALVEAAADAMD
jgi:hypothetical protein